MSDEHEVDEWSGIKARCTLWEDSSILVLNKPAGISVVGERHGADLLKLAQDAGDRIFAVHRIDKVTSGAILLAKDIRVHGELTRQFAKRSVEKSYLAITRSTGLPDHGTIDLPLFTASSGRVRIGAERSSIAFDAVSGIWSVPPEEIFTHVKLYPSRTAFTKICESGTHTLLAIRLLTGRRHQIRVHLAWTGHPIDGDPLFDKSATARAARTALHSLQLSFSAPWISAERVEIEAEPTPDFWSPLGDGVPAGIMEAVRQAKSIA